MRSAENLCLLPQANNQMLMATLDNYTDLAVALLTHYSFDLGGYDALEIVNEWQSIYPQNWLHLAVIEALYQGRYKAFSVQQILSMWERREQATYHFNLEFERLICSKFPVNFSATQPRSPELAPSFDSAQLQQSANITRKRLPAATSLHLTENGRSYLQEQKSYHLLPNSPKPEASNKKERATLSYARVTEYSFPDWEQLETKGQEPSPLPPVQTVDLPNSHPVQEHDNLVNNDSNPSPKDLTGHMGNLLPASTNHPPIGQFTPKPDNDSPTFTSKLYAMIEQK